MPKKSIEVKDLVKKYKNSDKNAVDHISFSLNEGSFFALLGPNGAGKTTTISILTTTLSKTSGTVIVAGFDIDKHPSEVRQDIGIIFQTPSLDENLTAEENIRFHAILYGLYPFRPTYALMDKSYKERVMKLAEVLDLQNDIFKPIKTFSGGMKRKLEIIRSLMHQPKVLFLDEPTSGLDPVSRKSLWDYLQIVRKEENTTILLTTHYIEEAEDADEIAIIKNGKIARIGSPNQLKKDLLVSYLLIDSQKRSDLEDELNKLKISYEVDEHIKIPLQKRSAQEIIQSINTPLSTLYIHSPSLSDAYIEIVEENHI